MNTPEHLDLAAIRARLAGAQGPKYWQSLEELAGTEAFQDFLFREFPRQASEWEDDEPGRRKFLKLMGASLALAGLSACTRQPNEQIMPYVRAPEEVVPGKPLFFATAMPLCGVATGLLVESHMGRPTKIEGNPEHPASLGAADLLCQASVLGLYDPDRSQTLLHYGEISSWSAFLGEFREAITAQKAKKGAGLRILTETVTSPSQAAQLKALLKDFPSARWHQHEPAGAHSARAGAKLAFGEPVNTYYRVENAKVILSLDSDFLTSGPGHVRYAREFAKGRPESRLYAVESSPTNTGAKADHRFPMRASEVQEFAAGLLKQLNGGEGKAPAALVADLKKHSGACLVVPGEHQSPAVHALAHALNQALGNSGKTVIYTEPLEADPVDQIASLRDLTRDMDSGAVEMLLILGPNPVYNAPADIPFAEKLQKVKLRIRLGLYDNETSALCHWHIPETHYLETWGDTRAYDGTVTIQQPLIAPLYRGKSQHELLTLFSDKPEQSSYEVVKGYWREKKPGADFEAWWRKSVHDGVVPGTAAAAKNLAPNVRQVSDLPISKGLEIIFRPDPTIQDGRFANNGWLQEVPKPLTKLTWDNAALMGPATAQKLNLENEAEIELEYNGRKVIAPVWITPGHAPDSVTVHLGYGRKRAGRVAHGAGFNAFALRTADAPWFGSGLAIRKTGGVYPLATTQHHWRMEGRHPVRAATLAEFKSDPDFAQKIEELPPKAFSLYPEVKYEGYAWGMAIDLSACTGCNACVVACQAENNIPVVGKDQVARGREMHWIRIDRYYEGEDLDHPATHHQPVLCMQCENAPCELVCPVAATNHSSEGLNDMVYNRCVGTRYCSNNCPYKVRRFNFFLYSDFTTESVKLQKNPDVTVRSRGVMEKCTYCVQRINETKITAEKQDRLVRDGEIVTACQQSCPSDAIVFGNINDKESRVAKLKALELNYSLLGDLNTRPRTTYLASLRNPNPELEVSAQDPKSTAVIEPGYTFGRVTDKIASIVQVKKTPLGWFIAFAISFSLLMLLLYSIGLLFLKGIGVWGVNVPVGWGFAIINFVWWIGIGHAGTLISAILLLLRQKWRTSINRFAEAMTLFAVSCAGLYPILHLGRPWLAYWLFPYPNTMSLWPQFRSPLIWDVFAVSTYATVSLLFWYVGLIPDMATLRDSATARAPRFIYGMLAMGWRGSAMHWHRYETASLLLAGLATPLVVSVHTIVSFDFAVSIVPGWHATIFPPYFVAGAIYSGFAMVMTLSIPLRYIYGLEDFITLRHLQNMAKIMLATGMIVGYGYMTETFMAWYSADSYEMFMINNRMTGPYWPYYWTLIFCNIVAPQLLWFKKIRTNVPALFVMSLVVNVGMWLERFVIVVTSLHRDFLPSSWGMYHPTAVDWMTYIGTFGLFLSLLFLFIRFLPMISIFEMRTILPQAAVTEEQK